MFYDFSDLIKKYIYLKVAPKKLKTFSFSDKQLDGIDIIIADVKDSFQMEEMCKNTKLVINCVGPVSWYYFIVLAFY